MPGYGIDCCGNDLTVTATYKVDVAMLLADPALASMRMKQGPQRAHLLLEHVECPSNPRPVHGDSCSTASNRCEMSRIRETVRLRLVPPRDYEAAKESVPVQKFLDEVREIRKRYPLDALTVSENLRPPFILYIKLSGDKDTYPLELRPLEMSDSDILDKLREITGVLLKIDIAVSLDDPWQFVAGTIAGRAVSDGHTADGLVTPPGSANLASFGEVVSDELFWNDRAKNIRYDLSASHQPPLQIVFKLADWQAQPRLAPEDYAALSGNLELTIDIDDNHRISSFKLSEAGVKVRPLPFTTDYCSGEPCAPHAKNDSTPVLPWLHRDPTHSKAAADPKVMLLATLGGWLTQMLRREAAGTAHEITTPRREIAEGIYHLAWVLLFGVSGRADSAELGGALKRLLEAWCEELLWKGPQCHGGPHGVVIGCAQLEGGTIQRVDPFGGRRHVVHYPLITHWAAQFGIAPPDISIARFFSQLCCVAGLAAPSAEATEALAFIGEFGSGFLAVGEPGQVMRKIAGTHTQIIAQRKVGMAEMIFSAIKLLRDRAPVETKKYSALVLEDFVAVGTVMLLQPETSVVFKPE